jgi:hypothetical protein
MAIKFGLLAVALFVAWMVLFRASRVISAPKTKPPKPAKPPTALVPCPGCGIYRLPGGDCDCDPRSTSQD